MPAVQVRQGTRHRTLTNSPACLVNNHRPPIPHRPGSPTQSSARPPYYHPSPLTLEFHGRSSPSLRIVLWSAQHHEAPVCEPFCFCRVHVVPSYRFVASPLCIRRLDRVSITTLSIPVAKPCLLLPRHRPYRLPVPTPATTLDLAHDKAGRPRRAIDTVLVLYGDLLSTRRSPLTARQGIAVPTEEPTPAVQDCDGSRACLENTAFARPHHRPELSLLKPR